MMLIIIYEHDFKSFLDNLMKFYIKKFDLNNTT